MIKQNQNEFDVLNLTHWHNLNYKGKNGVVVILDVEGQPHSFTDVIQPIPSKYTDIGHQTNVCSVVREIAPEATIYSFHWSSSFKPQIIQWIKEHESEIDVISFSVNSMTVNSNFYELEQFDIPVIVASGNDYREDRVSPYARLPWTIAVGAWVEHTDKDAEYSNGGEDLDIVAYTNIYIPTSDGYDRLMYFSGTSCAAPVVSGMLAVYNGWRKTNGFKKLTRKETYEFIISNTIDKLDFGYDFMSGHGLFVLPEPTIVPSNSIEEPIIEEPIIEEPVIEEPIEEEPIVIQPEPATWFFTVQKTWDDQQSSIGKFVIMSQAVEFAKLNPGYNVYDATGYLVYKGLPAPIIEEPVIEEPVIEEPVIEEPVIEEPIVEEPIEEPVVEEPIIEEPIVEEPTPEPAPDLNLIYKLLLQILEFLKKIFIK